MSALWRACGRSGRGDLTGDLRRVLRGERQARPLPTWFFALRADHELFEPLHAPDQQVRLI
jgi:hypothetical protein